MQRVAESAKVLVLQSSELRLPGRSVLRRSSAVLINSPSMFFVSPVTQTPAASALEPPPLHPRLARVERLLSLITVKLLVYWPCRVSSS